MQDTTDKDHFFSWCIELHRAVLSDGDYAVVMHRVCFTYLQSLQRVGTTCRASSGCYPSVFFTTSYVGRDLWLIEVIVDGNKYRCVARALRRS